jgi:diadenosine tetraphosphate (Ap4A) HIT family hydrolase
MFSLHPRLLQDTYYIGKLTLCRVLLMNNRLFPWLILVPERAGMAEIFQLDEEDRHLLIDEISLISDIINKTYWPDKINVAALGNQVPQLHVHIIARFKTDDAWPEPIWGKGLEAYDEQSALQAADKLREACKGIEGFVTIANQP